MPLPPIVDAASNGSEPLAAETAEPRLEFTYVESLMFAFHQLARQTPEFLNDNADRVKDFRCR